MVLWEITLGTAYFLGLKRTYRLSLRIQRKLITPKHHNIRDIVQRRTRNVFDVALKVYHNIQQRDIEVGRNLGNWILRWLDRMKPSAQIRGSTPLNPPNVGHSNTNITKKVTNSSHLRTHRSVQASRNQESDRHLFTTSRNAWAKPFPNISMLLRAPKPAGTTTHYRHLRSWAPEMPRPIAVSRFEGVIRKDILQYILHD